MGKKKEKKNNQNTKKNQTELKLKNSVKEMIPLFQVYKNGILEIKRGYFLKIYPIPDAEFRKVGEEKQEEMARNFGKLRDSFPPD